jgi:hypothetical protein
MDKLDDVIIALVGEIVSFLFFTCAKAWIIGSCLVYHAEVRLAIPGLSVSKQIRCVVDP